MAINPISFPQYQVNSLVDPSQWQTLANLGNVYNQAKTTAEKRQLLSQLGPDAAANANLLVGSGDEGLASLGLNLQNRLATNAREDQRFAVTDARADRALRVQENQDRRAQEASDEDTPTVRAKKVVEAGLDPKTPSMKEYILTGKPPPERAPTFEEQVEKRKQVAAQLGLQKDSPGYVSYVATGKMPREDAQPLTATDKKILNEADEQIVSGEAGLASLRRAKALSSKAFAGPGAGALGYATSFLGKSSEYGKQGIATENLSNEVLSNALASLKSIFGAAPTEGERKILVELQGSVSKPDAVRQDIYDRAILMGEHKLAAKKAISDQLRGGTYYKPGGGSSSPTAPKTVPTFKIEPD